MTKTSYKLIFMTKLYFLIFPKFSNIFGSKISKKFFWRKLTFFDRICHNSTRNNDNQSFDRFFSRKYYVSKHFYSIFAFPGNSREFFWDFPYFPFPGNFNWSGKSTALSFTCSFAFETLWKFENVSKHHSLVDWFAFHQYIEWTKPCHFFFFCWR